MKTKEPGAVGSLIRSACGVSLLVLGGWMLAATETSLGGLTSMLAGLALFVVGAFLAAPFFAHAFTGLFSMIFMPGERYAEPQPIYGIPAALRKKGLPQEALTAYEDLAQEFPLEIRPYLEMMDIAIVDLRNPELAQAVLERALATHPLPAHRESLRFAHKAIASRLEARKNTPPRKIDPRKG